jgi:hypothetical protein
MQQKAAAKLTALKSECAIIGRKPGEDKSVPIKRTYECLSTIAREDLKLGSGLEIHSPKYAQMLKRILAIDGSSLVYSAFLQLEGIGIFRICMDINGFAPIEIINTPAGLSFSKATEASFKKGPGAQPRYITFSGGEDDAIRRVAIDIFNANFNELPQNIKAVLESSGYTNNHKGDVCKVFCITAAGAEGLSLKAVRGVHIMEPYWNDVRLRQVKGRAIRIGSHLELPEEDRNVSIYTYISCFSPEAQMLKSGEGRIDETIRLADSVDKKEALTLKLPIGEKSPTYVVTTDERLYLIAQRKKIILDSLESTMKSAAIDCELNIQQNRDGSFKCQPLEGKIGDFMYHPNLDIDIRESKAAFSVSAAPATAPAKPDYILKKFKEKIYIMKPVPGGFEMYAQDDTKMARLLGTAGEKDGKPAPPVKFV